MRLTPHAWLAFTLAQLGLGAGRGSRVTQTAAPKSEPKPSYQNGHNKTRECARRMLQIERGIIFASKQIPMGASTRSSDFMTAAMGRENRELGWVDINRKPTRPMDADAPLFDPKYFIPVGTPGMEDRGPRAPSEEADPKAFVKVRS
jgi:hypothetical protein